MFYFVFEANFQVQAPGGLYLKGRFTRGFFALWVWGAYKRRGLFLEFNNCITKMEVGALSIQWLPLFAASPYIEIMPPWLAQQWNPAMSPHMKGKVEKKQQSLGGGGGGNGWKNPAQRKNWMRQWITWLI